jgi:hypothetical protein
MVSTMIVYGVSRANAALVIGISGAWTDLEEGRDERTPKEDAGGVHDG